MDLASVSLLALLLVVVVSCVTEVNIGLFAMTLAWLIGTGLGPWLDQPISSKTLVGYYPIDLFLTLFGTTLLFSIAKLNGTLRWLTDLGLSVCRGYTQLVPWLFFGLAIGLSACGAGNVPTVALLASSAMLTAQRLGISPLVMTIMIGHGSIGGTLSPISPMGIIAHEKLVEMQLGDHRGYTFSMNLAVNALVAVAGYVLFRGWRSEVGPAPIANTTENLPPQNTLATINRAQSMTLGLLVLLIVAVSKFEIHLGWSAIAGSTLLIMLGAADERTALRELPWNVVLLVCGMTVLVSLCNQTGGLDRFSQLLAAWATPQTVTGWMAGITGLISVFSSTSGVVLPAFLPTVPKVLANLPGATEITPERLLAVATAVNIGSNLVDVSSVSTLGALCVAATPHEAARQKLFRQALIWGLSMSVVGALLCGFLL